MKKGNKPLLIGITGGIGAGKSIVSRIFAELGIPVYDADSRAKWLLVNDGQLMREVKDAFGEESYHPDGSLNREYLANRVFSRETERLKLNGLVHPRVGTDFSGWVSEYQEHSYLIKEAALMFESGSHRALDHVIVVHAPHHIREQRILKRDPHRSEEQIQAIMNKQLSEQEFLKFADEVVHNDGSQSLIKQVLQLHEAFLNEKKVG